MVRDLTPRKKVVEIRGSWRVIVGMATPKLGQQVKVHKIMWSNGPGLDPTKVWMSGYTLEGIIDGVAVVKAETGLYAGCLVNYDLDDVEAVVEFPLV